MRWLLLAAAIAVTTGCGNHHHSVAVSADGSAVLADAQDGHLDKQWSCGSLTAALARFSPTAMRSVGVPEAAARACDLAVVHLRVGTTKPEVAKQLGAPEAYGTHKFSPNCWFYSWEPTKLSPIVGARICFHGDKVRLIQRTLPG